MNKLFEKLGVSEEQAENVKRTVFDILSFGKEDAKNVFSKVKDETDEFFSKENLGEIKEETLDFAKKGLSWLKGIAEDGEKQVKKFAFAKQVKTIAQKAGFSPEEAQEISYECYRNIEVQLPSVSDESLERSLTKLYKEYSENNEEFGKTLEKVKLLMSLF